MPHLIATIFSIALIGMSMLSTVSYTDPRQLVYQQVKRQLVVGFDDLETAWQGYRMDNQVTDWVCETHTTADGLYEDCSKEVVDEGYLPGTPEWEDILFPAYGFRPLLPGANQIAYGESINGYHFCIQAGFNAIHIPGIERALSEYPPEQLIVSDTCGATQSVDINTLDPSGVQLTYWVKRIS